MASQDRWILASFCFCVSIDLNSVLVHKHLLKTLADYPAILTVITPMSMFDNVLENKHVCILLIAY